MTKMREKNPLGISGFLLLIALYIVIAEKK